MDAKKVRVDESAVLASKPWIEKYRPQTLKEVQSQEEVVNALRACISAGSNMPHMLFHGPPGTGKTSAILAAAYELFGPDYLRSRVKELNASDDRGIQAIRDKVKNFAHGAVGSAQSKIQSDGIIYPVPNFKIIILDEADALLPDAQAALRRMMEDFSEVTRFCIICNYVSRIIDPIASRCAKFRFKPLTRDALYARIQVVASVEGISTSPACLRSLDRVARGDMRVAMMYLQAASRAHGVDLRDEDFVDVSGAVPENLFLGYVAALCSSNFGQMSTATQGLVTLGFAAAQIVAQLHRFLCSSACSLGSVVKSVLSLKLSETERRLVDGGDDMLQLLDIGNEFVKHAKLYSQLS